MLGAAWRAAVFGLIVYALVRKGLGVSVEASTIYATLALLGAFTLRLLLGVGALELDRDEAREQWKVLNARIAAHRQVWIWVNQAELEDDLRRRRPDYVLEKTTANVINALQMPGVNLSPAHIANVVAIAEGDVDVGDRVTELLAFLRENLVTGTYLMP